MLTLGLAYSRWDDAVCVEQIVVGSRRSVLEAARDELGNRHDHHPSIAGRAHRLLTAAIDRLDVSSTKPDRPGVADAASSHLAAVTMLHTVVDAHGALEDRGPAA